MKVLYLEALSEDERIRIPLELSFRTQVEAYGDEVQNGEDEDLQSVITVSLAKDLTMQRWPARVNISDWQGQRIYWSYILATWPYFTQAVVDQPACVVEGLRFCALGLLVLMLLYQLFFPFGNTHT